MGEETPPFIIPDEGQYLWNWFGELNSAISRVSEGVCRLIPPSEHLAWSKLSGLLVSPKEYDILQAMDRVYCEETNKELQSQRSKRDEEMKRQVDEAKSKHRRR